MKEFYKQGLQLESKTVTSDGLGGRTEEWSLELEFEAVLDLLGASAPVEANKIIQNSTHILMIADNYDDIVAVLGNNPTTKRVKYDGKIYNITTYDAPFDEYLEIFLEYSGDTYEV